MRDRQHDSRPLGLSPSVRGRRERAGASMDHSGRRVAPGESPVRNDNPWPDILALADPSGAAIETLLNVLALLRQPGSIPLG